MVDDDRRSRDSRLADWYRCERAFGQAPPLESYEVLVMVSAFMNAKTQETTVSVDTLAELLRVTPRQARRRLAPLFEGARAPLRRRRVRYGPSVLALTEAVLDAPDFLAAVKARTPERAPHVHSEPPRTDVARPLSAPQNGRARVQNGRRTSVRTGVPRPAHKEEPGIEPGENPETNWPAAAGLGGAAVLAIVRPNPNGAWSREACDDWNERFGLGSAPGRKIGRALSGLVDREGWATIRPRWRAYLAQADARFVSASRFAETWTSWQGGERRGDATPQERRRLDSYGAAIAGSLRGDGTIPRGPR